MIDQVDAFRAEALALTAANEKKSSAGGKPVDAIVMFLLYKLYKARDRLSLTLSLRHRIDDSIPRWHDIALHLRQANVRHKKGCPASVK